MILDFSKKKIAIYASTLQKIEFIKWIWRNFHFMEEIETYPLLPIIEITAVKGGEAICTLSRDQCSFVDTGHFIDNFDEMLYGSFY